DRTMPEEINRLLTDAISQWLFVSEPSGVANLRHEGVPEERIFFVGNVMIDTLLACRQRSETSPILEQLGLARGGAQPPPHAFRRRARAPRGVADPGVLLAGGEPCEERTCPLEPNLPG